MVAVLSWLTVSIAKRRVPAIGSPTNYPGGLATRSEDDRSFSVMDLVFLALSFMSTAVDALPAFPGAEGFGANTPGGRGGQVIKVTNLEPSGPGSLNEACRTKGPLPKPPWPGCSANRW